MDKQREEFEECDAVFWDSRPFWKAKYFSCDAMIDPTHMIQARTEFRLGWQAAQTARQPEIDRLASDKDELNDLAEKQDQQLSAANQRNKELEATLNQVRSTYNQIIAEDTATRNEYLDEIAKLEERIRVADAEEPKLLPPVTMEKALTVLMQTDDGDNEAERYLANIDDGCAFVVTKSEMFFHQLRLSVAKNPDLTNKISVLFYQNGEYKKVGLGYKDELRWPTGFLEGAWSMEIEISKVREAILKNADQPKKN